MRRISGLKDSLGGLFKSKKRKQSGSSDALQPAHRPLPPRYTQVFGRAPAVAPNISGSASETPSHHEAQATDNDIYAAAYREFEAREPELAADFAKHLNSHYGNTASDVLSSAEPLVQQLLADREKKQWRIPLFSEKDIKIRAQIEKLTKFLLWSDQIVQQAISAQPYAALAWSGVSILLPLIASGKVEHESMLGGFEYIGHVQMYWRIYEEGEHTAPQADILKALTTLYSHIVEYQARVICHLSRAQLSRTWQKLAGSNEWDGQRKRIDELDNHCLRLVSEVEKKRIQQQRDYQLREIQESQAILTDIRQAIQDLQHHTQLRYDDEKECALLQDLAADYEHYKNVNPLRVEGTCEWLFGDDDFRKWRDNSASSLLWISAGPGCGKSVLSRALIDEGRLSTAVTTSTVCYFFFQDGVDGQMDSCSALSAILHQLFTQDSTGELIKHALASHKNHGEKLRSNFAELWRIFLACTKAPEAGEIVCVFDALDECVADSRAQLLNALSSFYFSGWQRTRLKFLVTSRPYDDIEAEFKTFPNVPGYVQVDGDEKSDDISREINVVIDVKVQEFAGDFTEDHQRRLSERLKAMENRTYLWLHLTFDIIKKRRSAFSKLSRIQDLLDSIPSQVSEAYETILNHNMKEPEDRDMTRALFRIILAATRPLTLEEVNYALTMAASKSRHTSHGSIENDLWPSEIFKKVVKNLSGLFITVCDSRLSFIHLTAREFLTDTKNRGEWHGQFPIDASHATMASVCIHYLIVIDLGGLAGDEELMKRKYPFSPYASGNWWAHYNSQPDGRRQALCKDARKLCDTSGERGKQLSTIFFLSKFGRQPSEAYECLTDLSLASGLGLGPVVSSILDERNNQPGTAFQDYGSALVAAAGGGSSEVIAMLLQSVDDIEERWMDTNAAFAFAVNEGRSESIRALMDHGVEVRNVPEEDLEEVVGMALVICGKDMTIALLDMLGHQFPLTESLITTTAEYAKHGTETMEALLEKRGDEIPMAEFVLRAAASNRWFGTEMMQLLFRTRGGEIEITEGVLIEAMRNWDSSDGIVALLFKEQGDRIVITENVMRAAANESTKLIAFILENAPIAETLITEEVVTAAAGNRKYGSEMIKLFREKGDISVTEKALTKAAGNLFCGREIMELLFEAGKGHVSITEEVMVAAAGNNRSAKEILEFLLDTRGDEAAITNKVLAAARKNEKSEEVMALLLSKQST